MIRIGICDDHKIVCEGLKQVLNGHEDMNVVLVAHSGESLLKKLRHYNVDLLILDISLPGRSGLDISKQLQLTYPNLKILVLSMFPEDQFAIRMLKSGVSGYLHKDTAPIELIKALRMIAGGGKYLSERVYRLILNEITEPKEKSSHKYLSDREYEIMMLIGNGIALSEIANNLSLSVKTISTYRTRILEKMNLSNNIEIAKYLIANNLLLFS